MAKKVLQIWGVSLISYVSLYPTEGDVSIKMPGTHNSMVGLQRTMAHHHLRAAASSSILVQVEMT